MFYHLEGTVSTVDINLAVIDCGGIGFAVNTTANTLSQLRIKEKAKLYISEYVKEDAFDLYGFATLAEKRCFEMLLTVSGIGPKAAQAILSTSTPDGLALAIMNGDEKAITVAQGVGKKIAQRVILELRDKIAKQLGTSELIDIPAASAVSPGKAPVGSDAVAALMVLGYTTAEINAAMKGIDTAGMTTEQIIKSALRNLA